jgi:outer membrane protein TolC
VAAENQVIQASAAVQIALTSLAQFLNVPVAQLKVSKQHFLDLPQAGVASADVSAHPVLQEQRIAKEESDARLKVLQRSYYPKFNTQATMYARGTGANPDFTTGGLVSGLGPNIYNWGIGFTMSYSLMELPGLRVRREIEIARGRMAQVQLKAAEQIAGNTPILVGAAREARAQAAARYQAGLSSITELTDAERVLIAAEIDDSLARLGSWRAQLGVAIAQGDLTDFLARAEKP